MKRGKHTFRNTYFAYADVHCTVCTMYIRTCKILQNTIIVLYSLGRCCKNCTSVTTSLIV
jgi:hypothetical protein